MTIDIKMGEAEGLGKVEKKAEVGTLEKELEEFRTYRAEAAVLFRGTRAPALMDSVEGAGREIVQGYGMVHFLDDRHRTMMGNTGEPNV